MPRLRRWFDVARRGRVQSGGGRHPGMAGLFRRHHVRAFLRLRDNLKCLSLFLCSPREHDVLPVQRPRPSDQYTRSPKLESPYSLTTSPSPASASTRNSCSAPSPVAIQSVYPPHSHFLHRHHHNNSNNGSYLFRLGSGRKQCQPRACRVECRLVRIAVPHILYLACT
jgi:hypothetical protein